MIVPPLSSPARPLGEAFARAMAGFGPFESRPRLAVAVSGGADSMALALLADAWARARGGRIHGLTVDHGLRPKSGAEAIRVGAWLAARGLDHQVLAWTGEKPATAVQDRARAARYALLGGWCRNAGVLHLLLAHHRQDQAETLLMRLGSGSGADGLAGMSAMIETPDARVLRPLLDMGRDDLRAFLDGAGQPWLEDPSNNDRRFARVRLRQAEATRMALGVTADTLAAAARRFGDVRVALEAGAVRLLARATRIDPAGFAVLLPGEFADAPGEIAARALARVLAAVGGRTHRPSLDKTAELLAAARSVTGRDKGIGTLSGCAFERWHGSWLVRREARGLPAPEPMVATSRQAWDGRFDVAMPSPRSLAASLMLAPLGAAGWKEIVDHAPVLRDSPIPRAVRAVLPALSDGQGVVRVSHLGYVRPDVSADMAVWLTAATAEFRPRRSLAGPGFFVAPVAFAVDDAK